MEFLDVAKYLFMGIFIILFVMDILTKKSYKIHYYVALTVAIVFLVVAENWSMTLKVGAIAIVILLTLKTIVDERKKE
jgi:predicted branched-subunit amino acid permease